MIIQTRNQLLSFLKLNLIIVNPVLLALIFFAEYKLKSNNYIFQYIIIGIGTAPWLTFFYFKIKPTIQSIMFAMDSVSISLYILLIVYIVRFISIFPEFSRLYSSQNILIISLCIFVPFLYGLYYGYKRWSHFFMRIKTEESYNRKNMSTWSIMDILTDHPDSKNFTHKYWVFGLIANITPALSIAIGHSILFSLAGAVLLSLLPIHIGSVVMRRVLFYKHIGSNFVLVS